MKFRTEIPKQSFDFNISHNDTILLLGSCFTDIIGKRLQECKFKANANPFGVLYNPASIQLQLENLLKGKAPIIDELQKYKSTYFHYQFHSRFSHPDKQQAIKQMQDAFLSVNIAKTKFLFITFGTAWIYRLRPENDIVANCHKQSSSRFTREIMSVSEIIKRYKELIQSILDVNPNIQIVLSISPIRHLKDGFVENQRSKARLILAVETLSSEFDCVHYIPAYEILMDDLRDYRYYAEDLVHPSKEAEHYVWEFFSHAFFSESTIELNTEIGNITQAFNHKLHFPQTEETKSFCRKNLEKIQQLQKNYPKLDFENETIYFKSFLE
jgi:hypothetical protein